MNRTDVTWRVFSMYMLIILFMLFFGITAEGQIKVVHFNAEWNQTNDVAWFAKLSDTEKETMDVMVDDCQKKYQIAVVPTIIIFDDGEEVKRYQADLSFKMVATRKEVQSYIDELLMSKF